MVRSLVILLMLAISAHAEWYVGTNSDGRVVSVPVRTDPALAYVVGAISTSDAPASVQLSPTSSVDSVLSTVAAVNTTSTTAGEQKKQIDLLKKAIEELAKSMKESTP